jgi:hypothetical protein
MSSNWADYPVMPGIWRAYAGVLLQRRPVLVPTGSVVPRSEANVAELSIDPQHLEAYRRVCGFEEGTGLPCTYLHAVAMPLHLALLTGPDFPVRLLGLVHVANSIDAPYAVSAGDALALACFVEARAETERGQEFDLVTQFRRGGTVVWSETSTMLARRAPARGLRRAASARDDAGISAYAVEDWHLPEDTGRRYARISGDWNPIHLARPTARLFGYRAPIAHGMWSAARCVASWERLTGRTAANLQLVFKRPMYLPAQVKFKLFAEAAGDRLILENARNGEPHLVGHISPRARAGDATA